MEAEYADAADDWELEAKRQEDEEILKREEEERIRKDKEEKEKKRRVQAETASQAAAAVVRGDDELANEAKEVLKNAQQKEQDAMAAAQILGTTGTLRRFVDRQLDSMEDCRTLGGEIASKFTGFDGEFIANICPKVFASLLEDVKTSKDLRDLETALNVAKTNAKLPKKQIEKERHLAKNALDLETSDRGGAAEAQDDCGW